MTRRALIPLLIPLVVALPLSAQEGAGTAPLDRSSTSVASEPAPELRDDPAGADRDDAPTEPLSESSPGLLERRSTLSERAGAEVAQPSVGNFLYHVLLAAVTALVTALVWKAVT